MRNDKYIVLIVASLNSNSLYKLSKHDYFIASFSRNIASLNTEEFRNVILFTTNRTLWMPNELKPHYRSALYKKEVGTS